MLHGDERFLWMLFQILVKTAHMHISHVDLTIDNDPCRITRAEIQLRDMEHFLKRTKNKFFLFHE